ncbi:TrmH family RNA methyltransferase [Desulfovibrio inopinatus]|uniref:TrmH family RNA methyltransferase n=1 Tax=Desulfovibrio inopinatus TaxID=102109 RepID=UPI00040E9C3E|nr:RNA methyltransferase [Desulfovibrio inopinatus]
MTYVENDDDAAFVVGRKPVHEAVTADPDAIDAVFFRQGPIHGPLAEIRRLCKQYNIAYKFVPQKSLDSRHPGNHQGVVARLATTRFVELEDVMQATLSGPLPIVVVLDQVQDGGNVGTLSRTLLALGGGGIVLPKHGGAGIGQRALKASAGALRRLPVCRVTNLGRALDELAEHGFHLVLADSGEDAINAFEAELPFPMVLVLGGEEKGARASIAKRCPVHVRIPMPGDFESLNVAQAGAILLGLAAERRSSSVR